MNLLCFVNTNIGVAALRRHANAENFYFTQVWLRKDDGDWKKQHLFSREKDCDFSPAFLEAIYRHMPDGQMGYEDWW